MSSKKIQSCRGFFITIVMFRDIIKLYAIRHKQFCLLVLGHYGYKILMLIPATKQQNLLSFNYVLYLDNVLHDSVDI